MNGKGGECTRAGGIHTQQVSMLIYVHTHILLSCFPLTRDFHGPWEVPEALPRGPIIHTNTHFVSTVSGSPNPSAPRTHTHISMLTYTYTYTHTHTNTHLLMPWLVSPFAQDFMGLGVPGVLPEGSVVPAQFLEKLVRRVLMRSLFVFFICVGLLDFTVKRPVITSPFCASWVPCSWGGSGGWLCGAHTVPGAGTPCIFMRVFKTRLTWLQCVPSRQKALVCLGGVLF